uniref:L-seryl-tRNA(Sec) kinase n=1 Tax=Graphocephala atropunctata TaxID=36148 RepID=A0A1B6KAV4_9HEMI
MCYQRQICLVLLVGIPGSGKSFFRVFFEDYVEANHKSVLGSIQICSVCYDDYSSVKNPSILCDGNRWRHERLQIVNDVQNIIIHLKENNLKKVSELYPAVMLVNASVENPDCNLILIDDNMFYKSMRYEYFKVAKAYNLSFCQIFFDISLEKALQCNEKRRVDSRIPDRIIKTMFSKIEPPQPASNIWEVNSVSVSSYADFQDERVFNYIIECIKSAIMNPFKPTEMDSTKEEAQQITNSNFLHQIDNTLKQLVGICIKQKLQQNIENPHLISQSFSDKRMKILQQIKEKTIVLPIDFNSSVDDEKMSLIKPILFDLLQK